ncbi:MAG: glycosyltransferase, partial [Methanobacteriota archaeon]
MSDKNDVSVKDYPSVTVIVPCFNENEFIRGKIANLRSLDYPEDMLEIIFADGGSTDGTKSVIEDAIKGIPSYRLIETKRGGKIHQLNEVLGGIESEIIVNTDVDGLMGGNCLIELVKEFGRDENVGVVGAYITPRDCIPDEELYWAKNNVLRLL